MTNTPLNPDVLQSVIEAMELADYSDVPMEEGDEAIARVVIGAYLAVSKPVVTGEQVNRAGWTCDGIHEPGSYATCEDCREACNDLANFYNQMHRTPNASGPWTYRPEKS